MWKRASAYRQFGDVRPGTPVSFQVADEDQVRTGTIVSSTSLNSADLSSDIRVQIKPDAPLDSTYRRPPGGSHQRPWPIAELADRQSHGSRSVSEEMPVTRPNTPQSLWSWLARDGRLRAVCLTTAVACYRRQASSHMGCVALLATGRRASPVAPACPTNAWPMKRSSVATPSPRSRNYQQLADLGYSEAQVGLADIQVGTRDPAQIEAGRSHLPCSGRHFARAPRLAWAACWWPSLAPPKPSTMKLKAC